MKEVKQVTDRECKKVKKGERSLRILKLKHPSFPLSLLSPYYPIPYREIDMNKDKGGTWVKKGKKVSYGRFKYAL